VTVETAQRRPGGPSPEPGRQPGAGWRGLLRTKPVEDLVGESGRGHEQGAELRRSMGLLQLTLLSVGATLGTGIFVILGDAAPLAGPAVVLSFLLAAVTALFSALSYAELAGTIPVSGSSYSYAYSYAYATLGELAAWVSGWCLMAEYGVSVAAVAVGWGQYLNELGRSTLGVFFCAYLMAKFDHVTWIAFVLWTVVGLAAYALYGYRHSRLARTPN